MVRIYGMMFVRLYIIITYRQRGQFDRLARGSLRSQLMFGGARVVGGFRTIRESFVRKILWPYYVTTYITRKRYTLGSLIRPRAVTRCNLAVSGMYMRDFGKTHQIAYTYCSVGITDLKPLTGTSADQLPHRKSRSLATA